MAYTQTRKANPYAPKANTQPGTAATDPAGTQPTLAGDQSPAAGPFAGMPPLSTMPGGSPMATHTLGDMFSPQGYGTGMGIDYTKNVNSADKLKNTKYAGPGANDGTGGGGDTTGGNPFGTESGPGILENWFNQRATGTDPAYEYALGRGTADINNEFAARGGYNSGGALRRISDFEANMAAQRQGQLDALAGGASGEHQRRLEDMFGIGNNLASGQAGVAGAYDLAAGNALNTGNMAAIQLALDRAGVDPKARQGIINNILSALGLAAGAA